MILPRARFVRKRLGATPGVYSYSIREGVTMLATGPFSSAIKWLLPA